MSELLSKDDKSRVNNCEYYLRTKQVMKNAETYKDLEVGEVYYVKYKDYSGDDTYITGNNNDPAKFMVFHKDDGFVFVKRIIASGNLGKEVICLTTTYDVDSCWLEPDPDYVNSILLDNEDGYDPMAASKKMTANKNKARRRNKKLEIGFKDPVDAYNYVKSLKIGDIMYDAETAYGSGIVSWEVKDIKTRPVDKSSPKYSWRSIYKIGVTHEDQAHNMNSFSEVIEVVINLKDKRLPKSRRYTNSERRLMFTDFQSDKYSKYYRTKPYTVDDV